jgi:hypothetical protein
MSDPNIAEAGKATRFQKGKVPISPGRPKKPPISGRYATVAELPAPDNLLAALKLSEADQREAAGRPNRQRRSTGRPATLAASQGGECSNAREELLRSYWLWQVHLES